jgi:hypothetical protein
MTPYEYDFVADDDSRGLGDVFGDLLDDEYADATPEELDEALLDVLDELSVAEGSFFTSALRQIDQTLRDPAVARVAVTALPLAGGAAGTLVGGPIGTAIGTGLGTTVAKSLGGPPGAAATPGTPKTVAPGPSGAAATPGTPKPPAPGPSAAAATPETPKTAAPGSVESGSASALRGLLMSQDPRVLSALGSLAVGTAGRTSIDGVPAGAIASALSEIFAAAARDAEKLVQAKTALPTYLHDAEGELSVDPSSREQRAAALYSHLMRTQNARLASIAGEL